jgi:hypothetical protein
VATLWSAGTGLALQPAQVALDDTHARVVLAEPSPSGGREEPAEALLCRLAGVPVTLLACCRRRSASCSVARLPGCGSRTAGSRVGLSSSCRWHQPERLGRSRAACPRADRSTPKGLPPPLPCLGGRVPDRSALAASIGAVTAEGHRSAFP